MSVKSKVRSATRAVAKVFTPESDNAAEVDILDTLKKEHDEVEALLSDL
jgi:hemerythrin superfamily protein